MSRKQKYLLQAEQISDNILKKVNNMESDDDDDDDRDRDKDTNHL